MAKKKTKAELEAHLQKFMQLRKNGQIDLQCSDAEDWEQTTKEILNIKDGYNYVQLRIQVDNIVLDTNIDVHDEANYEVAVTLPDGTTVPAEVTDVEDWWKED